MVNFSLSSHPLISFKFHRALDLLASFVPRKSAQGPTNLKGLDILGNFIEEHILGIITEFANTINDFQVRQPIIEKRRGIIAIGEMIKIAHGHIGSALPQVCRMQFRPSQKFEADY
jgi:serine/threonine-protein kinase ATR